MLQYTYRNERDVGTFPYKKTLALLLALFIIAGALVVAQNTDSIVVKNDGLERSAAAIKQNLIQSDTDGDGLQDWEETLWGTDPRLADTDADGAIDGEEVRDGRNPLVPGPDDSLEEYPTGTTAGTETADATATDQVAQQFIGQYLTLKQQGVEMTEVQQEALVDSLLESAQTFPSLSRTAFSASDIFVGDVDAYTYGNELASILNRHTPERVEHELTILTRALEYGDDLELEKLVPIVEGYEGIIRDATTLSVPEGVRDIHVDFLNAALGVKEIISAMRAAFSDPIFALNEVSKYEEEVNRLSEAMDDLKLYFIESGTRFGPTDEGRIFVQ